MEIQRAAARHHELPPRPDLTCRLFPVSQNGWGCATLEKTFRSPKGFFPEEPRYSVDTQNHMFIADGKTLKAAGPSHSFHALVDCLQKEKTLKVAGPSDSFQTLVEPTARGRTLMSRPKKLSEPKKFFLLLSYTSILHQTKYSGKRK